MRCSIPPRISASITAKYDDFYLLAKSLSLWIHWQNDKRECRLFGIEREWCPWNSHWLSLPRVCARHLPAGWSAHGLSLKSKFACSSISVTLELYFSLRNYYAQSNSKQNFHSPPCATCSLSTECAASSSKPRHFRSSKLSYPSICTWATSTEIYIHQMFCTAQET